MSKQDPRLPEYVDKNPRASVGLFYDDDGVLLLRRAQRPGDAWSGHWALPGGHRDPGETPLQACIRECQEECAVLINDENRWQAHGVCLAGRHVDRAIAVAVFSCRLAQRPELILEEREVSQAMWLAHSEFAKPERHLEGVVSEYLPGKIFPYFDLPDQALWGFTYRVLNAFEIERRGAGEDND